MCPGTGKTSPLAHVYMCIIIMQCYTDKLAILFCHMENVTVLKRQFNMKWKCITINALSHYLSQSCIFSVFSIIFSTYLKCNISLCISHVMLNDRHRIIIAQETGY